MAEAIEKQEYDLKDIEIDIQPVEVEALKPGDHIAKRGNKLFTKYYHHGIFIGHEEGVIDFGSTELKLPEIRKIGIASFIIKNRLLRVHYPTGTCYPPKTTITMANEVLEDPTLWGPYNIRTNNCEHFAMKCKTGKSASTGVVKAMRNKLKKTKLKIAEAVSGLS